MCPCSPPSPPPVLQRRHRGAEHNGLVAAGPLALPGHPAASGGSGRRGARGLRPEQVAGVEWDALVRNNFCRRFSVGERCVEARFSRGGGWGAKTPNPAVRVFI